MLGAELRQALIVGDGNEHRVNAGLEVAYTGQPAHARVRVGLERAPALARAANVRAEVIVDVEMVAQHLAIRCRDGAFQPPGSRCRPQPRALLPRAAARAGSVGPKQHGEEDYRGGYKEREAD